MMYDHLSRRYAGERTGAQIIKPKQVGEFHFYEIIENCFKHALIK